jgi:hypothetical protein
MTLQCTAKRKLRIAAVTGLVFGLPVLALGNLSDPALAGVGHGRSGSKSAPAPKAEGGHHGGSAETHEIGDSVQVHTVHMAGESRSLAQHIVMELLLAAQGVETADKLVDIQEARQECAHILKGLRQSDERLALRGTSNPEILDDLDKVDALWARFDAKVAESIASGQISRQHVKAIDSLSGPLLSAMDGMVAAFEYFAYGGRTFSVLSRTVNVAQQQSSLTHKMAKEYLLIAYGHEVERNQIRLAETFAKFDRVLTGLVNGDPELRVLPAPNPVLKEQYAVVQRLWDDFRPIIESAAKSGQTDPAVLDAIAHRSTRLAAELNQAVDLYHQL